MIHATRITGSSQRHWRPEAWAAARRGENREPPSDRWNGSGAPQCLLGSGLVGGRRAPPYSVAAMAGLRERHSEENIPREDACCLMAIAFCQ
ncbi:hypothetical protein V496_03981 [Pseudogymnoascus sp. VKM F-4515 (FW-2607)]|nr:hypothetical protein V496_03981 [Pseudogymnoascus sp. VKM F-4515 (FW-2607)]